MIVQDPMTCAPVALREAGESLDTPPRIKRAVDRVLPAPMGTPPCRSSGFACQARLPLADKDRSRENRSGAWDFWPCKASLA